MVVSQQLWSWDVLVCTLERCSCAPAACLGQEGLLQSSSSALGPTEQLGPIVPQRCSRAKGLRGGPQHPGFDLEPAGEAGRVWRMYKIHEQSSLGMYKYINYQQFYKRHTASHLCLYAFIAAFSKGC